MPSPLGVLYSDEERRRKSFPEAVVGLIAHLAGAAIIFVAFFAIVWVVTVALAWLHALHPFPDDIFRFIIRIEAWFIYVDAFLCSVVLVAGAVRFVLDIVGRP